LLKLRGELRSSGALLLDAASVDSLPRASAGEDTWTASAVIIDKSSVVPRIEQIVFVMADELVRARSLAIAA